MDTEEQKQAASIKVDESEFEHLLEQVVGKKPKHKHKGKTNDSLNEYRIEGISMALETEGKIPSPTKEINERQEENFAAPENKKPESLKSSKPPNLNQHITQVNLPSY